ncbi:MAG: C2 family cysteine protease, partial [Acetobacteraceae bacterium]
MMRIHYSTSVGSNGGHPIFPDPFDQFGDPTDIGLPESGFAPARSTAGETGIASPHATAATAPTGYATATLTQVLYLQEAGNASLIAVSDINQGQIGDCFLLSSIGEVALWHPAAITNMIHDNGNGTETVTLYLAATGQLPSYYTTAFEAKSVTVNNTFPSNAVNNGATQDVLNGQKEIWVQVLEKAVATLDGGYGAISNGGSPLVAMEELTGRPTTWMSPAALTVQQLQGFMTAGDLIVMDTPSAGTLPYGLFNCHAYMFGSLTMVSGTAMVQLINPWGFDEPSAIPLSLLSTGIAEVDVGQFVASSPIIGGPGNDTITLPNAVINASIDLGAGNDTLIFANGTNSATVANTETIIGGTGCDTITLATATANASVDLGAGSDKLTLANATNTATVANVETLVGGIGNDTITLDSVLTAAMSVDLGAGSN